ncbi:MAG TPA: phosphatidylinositol mannoside acyltransferase [Beutenbergiaceae bacterium]|nr:phosphatidylinositol mannoside acyltransferase [Beutenbergiaceae bacterium]
MNTAGIIMFAWRALPRIPEWLVRGCFDVIAQVVHLLRPAAVRQLERNLARVRPDLGRRALRRVSRRGMRAYLRYYAEAFTLTAVPEHQLRHRVRLVNDSRARRHLAAGRSVVAALGHTGNWDLAGAWCGRHLARVLTVAEVLEPPELFAQFQEFRAELGMDVLGLSKDGAVLPTLARKAREQTYLVPLLADRDLSRSSIVVDVGRHQMRVAAGPAVLSEDLRVPLVHVFLRHERLRGRARKLAGSPWGVVGEFTDIEIPDDTPADQRIQALTQRWVDVLMAQVRRYPEQWHMLSKVFTADLDQARLARSHARQAASEDDHAASEGNAVDGEVPPGGSAPHHEKPGNTDEVPGEEATR